MTLKWTEVEAALREAKDPWASPHLDALVKLAYRDGPRVLLGRGLAPDLAEEIVQDTLAKHLADIIGAQTTMFGYFARSLRNAAIDRDRHGTRFPTDDIDDVELHEPPRGDALVELLEVVDRLRNVMSGRDVDIVLDAAQGVPREEIAVTYGVTEDVIAQVIHRARKRLRRGGDES